MEHWQEVVYRMVSLPVTLSNVRGHFKYWNPSNAIILRNTSYITYSWLFRIKRRMF